METQINRDHSDLNWISALTQASSISDTSDFSPKLIFNTSMWLSSSRHSFLASAWKYFLTAFVACLTVFSHTEISKRWEKQKWKRKRNDYSDRCGGQNVHEAVGH